MINKLYGLLVEEADPSVAYYRKSTQEPVRLQELQALVPKSREKSYLQFCADQICRIVSNSKLSAQLKELDPHNTYDRPVLTLEESTTIISGVPDGTTVSILENPDGYLWVERSIGATYDGVSTVSYGIDQSVEWGAAGTPVMSDGGLRFTFNGAAPLTSFTATIEVVRKPSRNLLTVLQLLDGLEGVEWTADFEPYKDSTVPTTRLAAYVLNMMNR